MGSIKPYSISANFHRTRTEETKGISYFAFAIKIRYKVIIREIDENLSVLLSFLILVFKHRLHWSKVNS